MKKKLKRVLIVLLVLFVVGEIAVRIYNAIGERPVGLLNQSLVIKKKYWHLKSHLKIYQPSRVGDIRYTFNKDGFRTRDHAKTSTKHRILILGDSVSFGLSVDDDKSYPVLLEKKLNKKKNYPQGVEIINLGIYSYGGAEELHVAKTFGLPLKPDAIFLQVHMNDFFKRVKKNQRQKSYGFLDRLKNVMMVAWLSIMGRSALYVRIQQGVYMTAYWLVHDWRRRNPQHLNQVEPKQKVAMFRKYKPDQLVGFREILKIRDLAKARGLPFAVMLSPNESQLFFKKYDSINKTIGAFCRKHNIRFLDPLPALRKDKQKGKLFTDGLHYSSYGNDVLSSWLAERWAHVMKPSQRRAPQPTTRAATPQRPTPSRQASPRQATPPRAARQPSPTRREAAPVRKER